MKIFTKKILRNFALFLLLSSGVVMVFMLFKLNETEQKIAQSLTVKPVQNTETEMKRFFLPVNNELSAAGIRGKKGFYYNLDIQSLNKFYIPIIEKFDQLSSMGIARSDGFELDIIPQNDEYTNRIVYYDKDSLIEHWSSWKYDSENLFQTNTWTDTLEHDPRVRPWFKGAISKMNQNEVYWTEPYVYNTTQKLGITASVSWSADDYDSLNYVLAYDLTLEDISKFTESLKATENSMTFVLSENEKFIGLPKNAQLSTEEQKVNALLKDPMDTPVSVIGVALKKWKENTKIDEPFYLNHEGEDWWFYFKRFKLSEEREIILGVAIPEHDLLAQINQTKYTIMGGFGIVFLLSLVVFISLRQTQKVNLSLQTKNKEIQEKNLIIEEKNKDIIDSLNYAKGLQNAILPRNTDLKKYLNDYFVFFQPKEVISGDFYWLNTSTDKDGNEVVFYAAADCTGHGVPGAMVSVVCANALNRCIKEYKLTDPGKILDKTRELVIETFEKSEKKLRDGMDISLVSLAHSVRTESESVNIKPTEDSESSVGLNLRYAGANNPLWIVRKTAKDLKKEFPYPVLRSAKDERLQLIEIKADKQPIGNYDSPTPFTTHQIELKKGDILYSFSDGYADQFGYKIHDSKTSFSGKKFKSKSLKKLLLSMHDLPMEEQREILESTFNNWKGELEQVDDICIIGVRL